MLLPHAQLVDRALYTSPPPATTADHNRPTLLVSWWCTGFALAIILLRLIGRYIRTERLFMEDKIMAVSIIPLLSRMALVHVILRYGTNNAIIPDDLGPEGIRRRELGSKLVLPSRILYAAFLWTAKLTVSEFLKRLTSRFWRRSYEIGLQTIRYFLLLTFIAVVIATLSECQPFTHYWQVVPDPGPKCRQGVPQLLTMGTSDVVTDLLLVFFPIPIVLKSNMPSKRKVSLVLLFALSLILVAITLYRVIEVIDHHYDQRFRSLLASLEILAAAAVSNALVLGSFVRDKGAKKQRWRAHGASLSGHSSQDQTAPARHRLTIQNWGSDADLAGDLGITCTRELKEKEPEKSRPAPLALPLEKDAKNLTPMPRHQPTSELTPTIMIDEADGGNNPQQHRQEMPSTPSGAAFFDIGGLLGDDAPSPKSRSQSHKPPQDSYFPSTAESQATSSRPSIRPKQPRTSSNTFLEDVGGLLPPDRGSSESSHQAKPRGLSLVDILRESGPSTQDQDLERATQSVQTPEIQDAGGLLK